MIKVNTKIGTPAVRFNPAFYKTAYNQFRQGIFRDLIEMMNRAEIDSHIAGSLVGRKAGFQRDFSLVAFSDSEADMQRAEWVKNVIKNLDHRNLFKDIQKAVLKKFSVVDFEWQVVDGRQVPVRHIFLDHKYFRYKDGVLKIDFGRELKDIPNEALVCETSEVPVLLPVLRDFILKDFGLESWASFIETFGEGMIIGKYPAGADNEFKKEVEEAVKAIARSSRGIMPDGAEITLTETQRTTGDHEKFVETANKGISIAILGHANAVEQSKGLQVGENISSYKVKREIAVDDMYFIDSCMQKLIRILIDRNFADGRYPVFEMDKKEPVNVKEHLEVVDTAFNHGLEISPDEYRKLGLMVAPEQQPLTKTSPF